MAVKIRLRRVGAKKGQKGEYLPEICIHAHALGLAQLFGIAVGEHPAILQKDGFVQNGLDIADEVGG